MSAATFADRVTTAQRTHKLFVDRKDDLEAHGVKTEHWIVPLGAAIEGAMTTDRRQEDQKIALKKTTAELDTWDRTMTKLTSSAIDAAIAAYGRDSAEGKNFQRMRSELHRPPDAPAAEGPETVVRA